MIQIQTQEPEFYFALREDLKDNPEFLPRREDDLSTGFDVRCAEPEGIILRPYEYHLIKLGFRTFSPQGWWLDLRPRSSSFGKKYMHCLYGVLDESWEGESMLACVFIPDRSFQGYKEVKFGDRIAQLIPAPRYGMKANQVSNRELDDMFKARAAQRGAGGFGSTGDK